MVFHHQINDAELRLQIRNCQISIGGNSKLKIYGHLYCKSGKRMNKENRVFFTDANEAIDYGYRPCGNCMRVEYKKWKNGSV